MSSAARERCARSMPASRARRALPEASRPRNSHRATSRRMGAVGVRRRHARGSATWASPAWPGARPVAPSSSASRRSGAGPARLGCGTRYRGRASSTACGPAVPIRSRASVSRRRRIAHARFSPWRSAALACRCARRAWRPGESRVRAPRHARAGRRGGASAHRGPRGASASSSAWSARPGARSSRRRHVPRVPCRCVRGRGCEASGEARRRCCGAHGG